MIFDIPDEILQDKDIIKILDGIAGSAKSSKIDAYFRGHYKRFTSTVRLMKDAMARYDCDCDTIAGGLFTTEDGRFFLEDREPEAEAIVLDEALQTNRKALEWCIRHRGQYNIIITTDSRQMMPKTGGEALLKAYEDLKKLPYVYVKELTYSYRPIDEETRTIYEELYRLVEERGVNAFEEFRNKFDTINYCDMPFDVSAVYLTHTNEIEEFLYRDKDIYHSDMEMIPKGHIAKRNFNPENYPILCQAQAEKRKVQNYLQASNIGSVTRYQGSEVQPGQKCYFMVQSKSKVTNREFYTAVTRCKDIKSFTIVMCDNVQKKRLKKLNNFLIKDGSILHLDERPEELKDLNEKTLRAFAEKMSDKSKDFFYSTERIYIDGEEFTTQEQPEVKPKFSINNLLKKDPDFDYDFMEDVYEILGENGIIQFNCPHFINDDINTDKRKDDYGYYLDFMSAYPHVLQSTPLPIAGKLYTEYDKDKLNFLYIECKNFPGKIITNQLALRLYQLGLFDEKRDKLIYLFTTDYKIGTPVAKPILEEVYKSQEAKKEVSGLHWGFLEKPYMMYHQDYRLDEGWKNPFYVRYEMHNRELLMVAILSGLYEMMLNILMGYYGKTHKKAWICVDALHFDDIDEMLRCAKEIERIYPTRPFRIRKKGQDEDIYKNYEIETAEERRKRLAREKKRRQRAKKKEQEC